MQVDELQLRFKINERALLDGLIKSASTVSDEFADELSKKFEAAINKVTKQGKTVMQLGGLFVDLFNEFSEASGDVDKLSSAMDNLVNKFEFLNNIEKKSGVKGLLNEFSVANMDKLLDYYDKMYEAEEKIQKIREKNSRDQIRQNAQKKVRSVDDLLKMGRGEKDDSKDLRDYVKKYIDDVIKENEKFKPASTEDANKLLAASRQYADLVSAYKKLLKEAPKKGSEEAVTQQLEIISILGELKKYEQQNLVLTDFRKKIEKEFSEDFKNIQKEASTIEVQGLTLAINNMVTSLIKPLQTQIAKIYEDAIEKATGIAVKKGEDIMQTYEEAVKVFNLQEEKVSASKKRVGIAKKIPTQFGGVGSAINNVEEEIDEFAKYYQSLEDAKQHIADLLNDRNVKATTVDSNNFEKLKDLIGYIQGYISLGGQIEDLNLDKTTLRRFNLQGMSTNYANQISAIKNTIIDAFKQVAANNYGTAGNAEVVNAAVANEVKTNPDANLTGGVSNELMSKLTGELQNLRNDLSGISNINPTAIAALKKIEDIEKLLNNFSSNITSITNGINDIASDIKEIIKNLPKDINNSLSSRSNNINSVWAEILSSHNKLNSVNHQVVEQGFMWNSKTGKTTNTHMTGKLHGFPSGLLEDEAKLIDADSNGHIHNHKTLSLSGYDGDFGAFYRHYNKQITNQFIFGLKNILKVNYDKFIESLSDENKNKLEGIMKNKNLSEKMNLKISDIIDNLDDVFLEKILPENEDIFDLDRVFESAIKGQNRSSKNADISKKVYSLINKSDFFHNFIEYISNNSSNYKDIQDKKGKVMSDKFDQISKEFVTELLEFISNSNVDFSNISKDDLNGFLDNVQDSFKENFRDERYQLLGKMALNQHLKDEFGIEDFYRDFTQIIDFDDFKNTTNIDTNYFEDILSMLNEIRNALTNVSFSNVTDEVNMLRESTDYFNNELDELKNKTNETRQDIDLLKDKVIELSDSFNKLQDSGKLSNNLESQVDDLSDNVVSFSSKIKKTKDDIQDLGDGTVRILSDIGMSYEDFIDLVKKESLGEANERYALIKDGKVIESLRGKWGEVSIPEGTDVNADKVIHSHPRKNKIGGAFSSKDYEHWLENFIEKDLAKQFELIWDGNTVSFDISRIRQSMFGHVYAALVAIEELAGEQLFVGGKAGLPAPWNNDLYVGLNNILLKGIMDKFGGDFNTSFDLSSLLPRMKEQNIDINKYFTALESIASFQSGMNSFGNRTNEMHFDGDWSDSEFKRKLGNQIRNNEDIYNEDAANFINVYESKEEAITNFCNVYQKLINLYKEGNKIFRNGDFSSDEAQKINAQIENVERIIGFSLYSLQGGNEDEFSSNGFHNGLQRYITSLGYSFEDIDKQLANNIIDSTFKETTQRIINDDNIFDYIENLEESFNQLVESLISQESNLKDEFHNGYLDWARDIDEIIEKWPELEKVSDMLMNATSFSTSFDMAKEKVWDDVYSSFLEQNGYFRDSIGSFADITDTTKETISGLVPDVSFINEESLSIEKLYEELNKLFSLLDKDGKYNTIHKRDNIKNYLSSMFPTVDDIDGLYEAINAHLYDPDNYSIDNAAKSLTNIFLSQFYNTFDEIKSKRNELFESYNNKSNLLSAKEFYDKYGTPTQALDHGMNYDEVFKMLGGRFSEMNSKAEDFSELKLNNEFFKDLIKDLTLTDNQLTVIKASLEEVDAYVKGGELRKFLSDNNADTVVQNRLNLIHDIINGEHEISQQDLSNAKNLLSYKSNETPILPVEDELSDVGLTYDQLINKIRLENEEIEKGNEEFKERVSILKDGLVIASKYGSYNRVDSFDLDSEISADKLVHTHPTELGSNVFGGLDYLEFINTIQSGVKNIDLISGNTLSNFDFSKIDDSKLKELFLLLSEIESAAKYIFGDEFEDQQGNSFWGFGSEDEIKEALKYVQKYTVDTIESYGGVVSGFISDNIEDVNDRVYDSFCNLINKIAKSRPKNILDLSQDEYIKNTTDILNNLHNNFVLTEHDEPINQDSSPALIKVKPAINPQEFADEVSEQLIGHTAQINIMPKTDDPNLFVTEVSQSLNGWNANIDVQPKIDWPSKFAETVSEQIQFSPAQIPVEPLPEGEFDSERFAQQVTNRLIGENAKINVDLSSEINQDGQNGINVEVENLDGLNESLDSITRKIGQKTAAFVNEQGVVDKVVNTEKAKLSDLKDAVDGVTSSVKKKTQAFNDEAKSVNAVLKAEQKQQEQTDNNSKKKKKKQLTQEELAKEEDWKETRKMMKAAQKEYTMWQRSQELNKKKEAEKQQEQNLERINKYQDKYNDLSNTYNTEKYPEEYVQRLQLIYEKIQSIKKLDVVEDSDIKQLDDLFDELSKVDKLASSANVSNYIVKINKLMRENTKMGSDTRERLESYIEALKDPQLTKGVFRNIVKEVNDLESGMIRAGKAGKSLLQAIKEKAFYRTAQYISTYFSFQDIIRYGKQAAQNVINLNTQFTELAKVSDSTINQLEKDFSSYANTAKDVGSTITDTIAATADWARMGYNLPDSKELARVALIYKNVGDGIDISTANESLISTLQGFQLEAKDAMHIIDVFNETSNNFAISSGGIGEALKRSAASFNAANTDLQKSVALVTTTNTVLQDPQVVGNLWKTMSARIRGAKTELEELNEEEDEFTESTSKLRGLVKGLTGFDIMKDKDTYKDLYDIMIGIGKEWQNLTDIERASLGEALAGKRMANGLYAVLNNIDTLEKAYKTASESEGSAMREQERYQQSIQYSIDRTKASVEELSQTLISSDLLKFLVDVANGFINITNEVTKFTGLLGTIGAVGGGILGAKNLGRSKKFLLTNMPRLTSFYPVMEFLS